MTFHFAYTNVGGNIPRSMSKMDRLREVNASHTKLTGELPPGGVLSGRESDRYHDFEATDISHPSDSHSKGVDGKSVLIGVASSLGVAAVIAVVVMSNKNVQKRQNEHT